MYNNKDVISYFQANNILALILVPVLTGVGKAVSNQSEMTGAGATPVLYYTSSFTDEHQNPCHQQRGR